MSWTDWIDGIYAAGLGETTWEEATRPIKQTFSCSSFGLAFCDRREGALISDPFHPDLSEEVLARYPDYDNPLIPHVMRGPPGLLVSPESLGIEQSYRRSAYYQEWSAPNHLEHSLVGRVDLVGDRFLGIGLHRRAADGAFTRGERDTLQPLVPHLARSARIYAEGARRRQVTRLLDNQLARRGCSTLVVDARLTVTWSSPHAEASLARSDAVRIEGRRLMLAGPDKHAALQRAVRRALEAGVTSRLRVDSLHVEVQAMQEPGSCKRSRCAVFVTHVGRRQANPATWLRESYGLTAAEASVAVCLAGGLSTNEIAERRQVSRGTVRSQLKQIFVKLGVRRQAEVVRLLSRLPDAEAITN